MGIPFARPNPYRDKWLWPLGITMGSNQYYYSKTASLGTRTQVEVGQIAPEDQRCLSLVNRATRRQATRAHRRRREPAGDGFPRSPHAVGGRMAVHRQGKEEPPGKTLPGGI